MSGIALYNTLRKIPEVSEAKEAVADIMSTKEVATKADIAELKTEMANLEMRLTKLIYAVAAINTGVIIAAVGLMVKFL